MLDTLLALPESVLLGGLYLALGGLYLLVVPGLTYWYLNLRWHAASSIERTLAYFVVFLFFPGMLLLAPFLNFRPRRRKTS